MRSEHLHLTLTETKTRCWSASLPCCNAAAADVTAPARSLCIPVASRKQALQMSGGCDGDGGCDDEGSAVCEQMPGKGRRPFTRLSPHSCCCIVKSTGRVHACQQRTLVSPPVPPA